MCAHTLRQSVLAIIVWLSVVLHEKQQRLKNDESSFNPFSPGKPLYECHLVVLRNIVPHYNVEKEFQTKHQPAVTSPTGL